MDKFLSLAHQIRELVAKDRLKDALEVLHKSLTDFSELDEVILQQARLKSSAKKFELGHLNMTMSISKPIGSGNLYWTW